MITAGMIESATRNTHWVRAQHHGSTSMIGAIGDTCRRYGCPFEYERALASFFSMCQIVADQSYVPPPGAQSPDYLAGCRATHLALTTEEVAFEVRKTAGSGSYVEEHR